MAVASRTDTVRPKSPRTGRGQEDVQTGRAPLEGWPPAILTPVPPEATVAGDGGDVLAFVDAFGVITKDSIGGTVGSKLDLLPWQRQGIRDIFARDPATGRRRHKVALWGTARKNGKSSWAAPIAVRELVLGPKGGELYSCAADRDQAKLIFAAAKRTIELNPDLGAECRIFRDTIEHKPSGSIYRALSSEAFTKEGLSPTLVIADELHAWPNRDLYDVMQLAMGARVDPLMLIVTTAGVKADTSGQDSICYLLYQYGKRVASGEVDDPTFYMAWWQAPDDADVRDEAAWAAANPGLGAVLDPDDLRSAVLRTPEAEFKTKRLNQFVNSARSWLPQGAWEACAKPERVVSPTEPVVLGFDGAWTNDSVAIVATCVADRHQFVVGSWERPLDDAHWRVDSDIIDKALRDAVAAYNVVEIAADPHEWRAQLSAWQADGLPISEWPTNSLSRIVPACREFYTAVMERTLSHDGDPRLARHLANAVIKEDRHGARITKERSHSPRKIDLAVAAVISYDRACYHTADVRPTPRFFALD